MYSVQSYQQDESQGKGKEGRDKNIVYRINSVV